MWIGFQNGSTFPRILRKSPKRKTKSLQKNLSRFEDSQKNFGRRNTTRPPCAAVHVGSYCCMHPLLLSNNVLGIPNTW